MTDTHPDSSPNGKTPADSLTEEQVAAKAKIAHREDSERLDEGLEETFPASDPVAAKHIT